MRKSCENHEKDMKKYKIVLKNLWEGPERVMRKSWELHKKVVKKLMRKSWESHKKVLKNSWESHEKFMKIFTRKS